MTRTLVEVPAEMFVELRRCFSDPEIVELTTAIAWENWRARFNHALDIESQGFSEGASCVLGARVAPREQAGATEGGA